MINYGISGHEIITGKLICLMELGRQLEAELLVEESIHMRDQNYYEYVHIYLTILFQTNQYEKLMEQVSLELEDDYTPEMIREQFQQLYDMSANMQSDILDKKTPEYIADLITAVQEEDFPKQWKVIENMRKMKMEPTEKIIHFLNNESIHPVIKTVIFKWLRDKEVTKLVKVSKLGKEQTLRPSELYTVREHALFKRIILLINEVEQQNPTLFIFLEQLLYRYTYVCYPILSPGIDVILIAEALKQIGEEYMQEPLNDNIDEEVKKYIEEIKLCEKLYLSVIEE